MKILRRKTAPENAAPLQKQNVANVRMEALGIGIYVAAINYLPIFLTRLGATHFQVGLLTSIPSLGSFLLTIPVGRFLQGRRDIVRWYSGPRLLTIFSYAWIGLLPFVVPLERVVPIVLLIRAAMTLPQTLVFVAFSVLMNAVAGPQGRYELLSRRWSILFMTTAVVTAIVGQVLDRVPFPLNYQLAFVGLSLSGMTSYYFATRIQVPDWERPLVELDFRGSKACLTLSARSGRRVLPSPSSASALSTLQAWRLRLRFFRCTT